MTWILLVFVLGDGGWFQTIPMQNESACLVAKTTVIQDDGWNRVHAVCVTSNPPRVESTPQ